MQLGFSNSTIVLLKCAEKDSVMKWEKLHFKAWCVVCLPCFLVYSHIWFCPFFTLENSTTSFVASTTIICCIYISTHECFFVSSSFPTSLSTLIALVHLKQTVSASRPILGLFTTSNLLNPQTGAQSWASQKWTAGQNQCTRENGRKPASS